MTTFRYSLDRTSRKYICPQCGQKRFVRYVDNLKGNLMPEQYGRCDREVNCGYHLNPYHDPRHRLLNSRFVCMSQIQKVQTFFPKEILIQTLNEKRYQQNRFVQNLLQNIPYPLLKDDVEKVISDYYIGTAPLDRMSNATTFPFIDVDKNIRTIQVRQFNMKNHGIRTSFLHSLIEQDYRNKNKDLPGWLEDYKQNERFVSCLFGEHLLKKYECNPVALVEAPKTAIYCTLYFGFPKNPNNFIWLAVYNLSSLNSRKCKVLRGRKVTLFPDLSCDGSSFDLWQRKSRELSIEIPGTQFNMSDLLENFASTELRKTGADIADILINLDWRRFR